MALPSSVTLGSLALVVTAGAGLIAVTAYANRDDTSTAKQTSPTATADSPTPEPKAKPKPTSKPKPKIETIPETVVEVYNNSGISGLAADRAAELQSAGWQVGGTDNWYGEIADNTVYYPADLKSEAKQLAEAMGIDRLRPAVSGMQLDRLTVILTHG